MNDFFLARSQMFAIGRRYFLSQNPLVGSYISPAGSGTAPCKSDIQFSLICQMMNSWRTPAISVGFQRVKTLTVEEATPGLGQLVDLALAGERIQIRKDLLRLAGINSACVPKGFLTFGICRD